MKLKTKLAALKRVAPKCSRFGQLYARVDQTKKRYKSVTLYTLLVSEEQSHLLLPHIFASRHHARSPAQWHAWFGTLVSYSKGTTDGPPPIDEQRLTHIHRVAILPGVAVRTNKAWSVKRIIGWTGGARQIAAFKKRS